MTNNHSIAENPESNNPSDNLVDFVNSRLLATILDGDENEEDDDELIDMDYKGDNDDDWNELTDEDEDLDELIDEDEDWNELTDEDEDWVELTDENEDLDELIDEDEDWNECEEDDEPADRYDDREDEYDITRNPYYNDNLDFDEQSPEFLDSVF